MDSGVIVVLRPGLNAKKLLERVGIGADQPWKAEIGDDVRLLLKTFEVGPEVSPADLIEPGLVQNDVEYELRDVLRTVALGRRRGRCLRRRLRHKQKHK